MDIDVLTAFVRVLAEWKPGQTPVTGEWIRGYDTAMEGIAKQARQTLELASKTSVSDHLREDCERDTQEDFDRPFRRLKEGF